MGMFDIVRFTTKDGKNVDLQFKAGDRRLKLYEIGQMIDSLEDGIYFNPDGAFVVYEQKIVAAFKNEDQFLFETGGAPLPYPTELW